MKAFSHLISIHRFGLTETFREISLLDKETVNISGVMWDIHDENKSHEKDQSQSELCFNLEGMDQSWNSSIGQDITNQNIPQLDGISDDKEQDCTLSRDQREPLVNGSSLTANDHNIKSNDKIQHLGELQVLLKAVQKQREAMKSTTKTGCNGMKSGLMFDLRDPTPVRVHCVEESCDSDADSVDDKVACFTLESSGNFFLRVSASEESDTDSINDTDFIDDHRDRRTKLHRHGNIFSTMSSELSVSKRASSNVNPEISRDLQLPFNRHLLSTASGDKKMVKSVFPSNGSERLIESDSDERYSVDSYSGFRKTGYIVPRRPSSESSMASTDSDPHIGQHAFTYDHTTMPRKERHEVTRGLDRNKAFPKILEEIETTDGSPSQSLAHLSKDNVCYSVPEGHINRFSLTQLHEGGISVFAGEHANGEVPMSDMSEYEELLPDQDSTSISESEAGMLDLTGCDDPVDIIEFTSDLPDIPEKPVRKRGRPPGSKNKKISAPPRNKNFLLNHKSNRKTKSPMKINDLEQDFSSLGSSAALLGSLQDDYSDFSFVPCEPSEVDKTAKMSNMSPSKKKRKHTEPTAGIIDCKQVDEEMSRLSNFGVNEGDFTRTNDGDRVTSVGVKNRRAGDALRGDPAEVSGKEERVWFSSTACINYCEGLKSRNLHTLECCVQVRKDEFFTHDFSKICNEKLCLNSVTGKLPLEYPTPTSTLSSNTRENPNDLGEKMIKRAPFKPRIMTDIVKDDSRLGALETIDTATLKHPAFLTVKALERGSSRRSSADGQVSEKGQVCQLDFSFLENPMDTEMEAMQRSEMEDQHLQLHTPPLVIDPDQNENMSAPALDQEDVEMKSVNRDTQSTISLTESRDNYDKSTDAQDAESKSCSLDLAVTSSQNEEEGLSNVNEFINVENPHDSLTDSASKKYYTKLGNKNKAKKRPKSLSGYYSDVVDDWEDKVKRKKPKHTQSEHYKYRFKRRSADSAENAFSLIYQMESSTAVQQEDAVSISKKQYNRKEKLISGVHYIIINKFKGYKSMCVVMPKLKITRSVNVNDYLNNIKKYCWKRDEEPTTYEREQGTSDDSSQDSDGERPAKPARGRKPGQAKTKRKQPKSMYERLSRCFVTRKPRRKKSNGTQSTKFMNTLSLLHDITLAKLTDSPSIVSYSEGTDDHKTAYSDVMFNLALFSPPSSETGGISPPQPLSPGQDTDSTTLNSAANSSLHGRSSASFVTSCLSAQASVETPYDTPLSSVETNKYQSNSPENSSLLSSENVGYHSIDGGGRSHTNSRNSSPPQPGGAAHRRDSNSSGSPYAVKEAVVRLAPPVGTGKLFTSKYHKDVLPPDLGPPLCRQVSPRSLNSESPPSLHSRYDRSPRLVDSDGSGSDEQINRKQKNRMYLYSDSDNAVTQILCRSQHTNSQAGSSAAAAKNSTRQSFDSDSPAEGVLPQTISQSYSNKFSGSQAGSGRGSYYSNSNSNSPRNKYEVQCEPISDSSDGEEEPESKQTASRGSSEHSSKTANPPGSTSALGKNLLHSPHVTSPLSQLKEENTLVSLSGSVEALAREGQVTMQSPASQNASAAAPQKCLMISDADTCAPVCTQTVEGTISPTLPKRCTRPGLVSHGNSSDSPQQTHAEHFVHTPPLPDYDDYTQTSGQSMSAQRSGHSPESPYDSVHSAPQQPQMAPTLYRPVSETDRTSVIQHNKDGTTANSDCHNNPVTMATAGVNNSSSALLPSQHDIHSIQQPVEVAASQSHGETMHPSPPLQGSNLMHHSSSHKSNAAPSSAILQSSGYSSMTIQQSPSYGSDTVQQSPSYSSSTVQQSPSYSSNTVQQSPSYSSSTMPLSPSYSSSIVQQSPSYSSSTMQQSPSYSSSSVQQSPSYSSSTVQQSPSYSSSIVQQSPSYSSNTIQQSLPQHSPGHCNTTVKQSPVQHSPVSNYGIQHSPVHSGVSQHSVAAGSMTQQSPLECGSMQQSPSSSATMQPSPSSSATLQLSPSNSATMHLSPLQCGSVQKSPAHCSNLQQSPIQSGTVQRPPSSGSSATMQQSPAQCSAVQPSRSRRSNLEQSSIQTAPIQQSPSAHSSATLQQTPQQYANAQLSPHNTALPPDGHVQQSSDQTFISALSPVHNLPPQLLCSPSLHISSPSQVAPQLSPGQSVPQTLSYSDSKKRSVKNKKMKSVGDVNSDSLSPVSNLSQNSARGSYPSSLHCQDYASKNPQNFESGLISPDERNSMLTEIRQFDATRRSRGDQQVTDNCYMPPHHLASMFDLNRHGSTNMGMFAPGYSSYSHRHVSEPGGASFTSMSPMYHSPPALHQNQHNFVAQFPTNGGSQGETPHHSVGPTPHPSHYPPRSCGGYEHSWNSHPGMYPTSAFRHASCGREEPPGWYPHSTRDPLTVITPVLGPPAKSHLLSGILGYGLSEVQHRDPYCSNLSSVPDRPR